MLLTLNHEEVEEKQMLLTPNHEEVEERDVADTQP